MQSKPPNKPELQVQSTTLWEYPSQHYGETIQGDQSYIGATPSWLVWNLLQRYTRKNDLVVDPMCGSGTTIDVCKDLQRRFVCYDIAPRRADIFRADARKLPLENEVADFVFIDPPYSTHIEYSEDPECIGKLSALEQGYYEAMERVIAEACRVLKKDRYLAVYVSDSFQKGRPFMPIGFRLFAMMERRLSPVDIVCVVRHNRTLKRRHWHTEAVSGNYYLRGFNYLIIMRKTATDEGHKSADLVPGLARERPARAPHGNVRVTGRPRRPARPQRQPRERQARTGRFDRDDARPRAERFERDDEPPRRGPRREERPEGRPHGERRGRDAGGPSRKGSGPPRERREPKGRGPRPQGSGKPPKPRRR